jgi:hypothetical protein
MIALRKQNFIAQASWVVPLFHCCIEKSRVVSQSTSKNAFAQTNDMRSTLKCFEDGICGGALLISGLKEHKHVGNIRITQ